MRALALSLAFQLQICECANVGTALKVNAVSNKATRLLSLVFRFTLFATANLQAKSTHDNMLICFLSRKKKKNIFA